MVYNRSKCLPKVFAIILWICGCMVFFLSMDNFNLEMLTTITVWQFVFGLFMLYISGFSMASFAVLFEIFSFLFHGGQPLLEYLDINAQRPFDIYLLVGSSDVATAMRFYIGTQFMLIFGMAITHISKQRYQRIQTVHPSECKLEGNDKTQCRTVFRIGRVLFCVGLLPRLFIDISQFILFLQGGYLATYTTGINGYVQVVAYCFQVGILMMVIGQQKSKKNATIITIAVTAYFIITMLKGGRATQVVYIIALWLLYFKLVSKITFKKSILILTICYTGIVFLSVIGNIRSFGSEGYSQFSNLFKSSLQLQTLWNSLGEFGGTAITLCYSVIFFPKVVPFAYGVPYITSFMSLLPNIGGILTNFQSKWIYVNQFPKQYRFALGGSYAGELFYNFGFIGGIIAALVLGILIGKYSNAIDKSILQRRWLRLSIYMIPFATLLIWIRGYFADSVRQFVWIAILVFMIYKIQRREHVT